MASRFGVRFIGVSPAAPSASQRNWSAMMMRIFGLVFETEGSPGFRCGDVVARAGRAAAAAERLRNSLRLTEDLDMASSYIAVPQHLLYFLPLPQMQGSFRPGGFVRDARCSSCRTQSMTLAG